MGSFGSNDTIAIQQAIELFNTLPPKEKKLKEDDFYLARTASGSLELVKKRSLRGVFLALRHRFWWKGSESRLNIGLNWKQARALLRQVVNAREESWKAAVKDGGDHHALKEKIADLADFLTKMQAYVAPKKMEVVSLKRSLPARRIDRLLRKKVGGKEEKELRQTVQTSILATLSPAVDKSLAKVLCDFVFGSPEKEFLVETILDDVHDAPEMKTALSSAIWESMRFEQDPSKIDMMIGWTRLLSSGTETPTPLQVDLRELSQVFGDHFIGGLFSKNSVEGGISAKNYATLLAEFLKTTGEDNPRLRHMRALLAHMQNVSTSESVSEFQRKVRNEVQDPETRGCLLSGGWKGHCVVFEIEKQENGNFAFRVYNKGDGISYHRSIAGSITEKIAPCLAVCDISKEIMLSPSILGMLQSMVEMDPEGEEKPQDLLARVLLPALGGVPEPLPDDVLGAVSPQRSGTCTYMSLDAFLAHSCTQHEYRELKFRFRTFLLDTYREHIIRELDAKSRVTAEKYSKIKMEVSVLHSAVAHYADRLQKLRADVPAIDVKKAQDQIVQYELLLKRLETVVQAYEKERSVTDAAFLRVKGTVSGRVEIQPSVPPITDPPLYGRGGSRTWSPKARGFLDFVQKLPRDKSSEQFPQNLVSSMQLLLEIPPSNKAEFAFCFDILCRNIPSVSDWNGIKYPDPQLAFRQWQLISERLSTNIYHDAQPEAYLQFLYATVALHQAYLHIPNVPQIPLQSFFPPQLKEKIDNLTTTDPFWAYRLDEMKALCSGEDPWPSVRMPAPGSKVDQKITPDDIGKAVWAWLQREEQKPLMEKIHVSVQQDRTKQAELLAERKAEIKVEIEGVKAEIAAAEQEETVHRSDPEKKTVLEQQKAVIEKELLAIQKRLISGEADIQRKIQRAENNLCVDRKTKVLWEQDLQSLKGRIAQTKARKSQLEKEQLSVTEKLSWIYEPQTCIAVLQKHKAVLELEYNEGAENTIYRLTPSFWPLMFDKEGSDAMRGRFLLLAREGPSRFPNFFSAKIGQPLFQNPDFDMAAQAAVISGNIFSKLVENPNVVKWKDAFTYDPEKGDSPVTFSEDLRKWVDGIERGASPHDMYVSSRAEEMAMGDVHHRLVTGGNEGEEGSTLVKALTLSKKDPTIPLDLASDVGSMVATPVIQIDTVFEFFKRNSDKLLNNAWIGLFHRILFGKTNILGEIDADFGREFLFHRIQSFFADAIINAEETEHFDVAANLIWIASTIERYIEQVSKERVRKGKSPIGPLHLINPEQVKRLVERLQSPNFSAQRPVAFEALLGATLNWVRAEPNTDQLATVCILQWLHRKYEGISQGRQCDPRRLDCQRTMDALTERMRHLPEDGLVDGLNRCKPMISLLVDDITKESVHIEAFDSPDQLLIRDGARVYGWLYISSGDFVPEQADAGAFDQKVPGEVVDLLKRYRVLFGATAKDWADALGRKEAANPPGSGPDVWKVHCKNIFFRVAGEKVYVRPPGREKWFLILKPGASPLEGGVFTNCALKNRYHCLQDGPSLLIADRDTYEVRYKGVDGRMVDAADASGRQLVSAPPEMAAFEDPKWTVALANAQGVVQQIEFPRLQVSLERKELKSGSALAWKGHKGWYLTHQQYIPDLVGVGALVFEKKPIADSRDQKAETLVLCPVWDPKKMPEESFPPKYQYDYVQDVVTTATEPRELISAETVEFGLKDGELVPKSLQARYYLARILAEQGDFDKAEKLLFSRSAFATKERLSQGERDILEKIALNNFSNSIDPRKTRLRVQALLLLRKNEAQFPLPQPSTKDPKNEKETERTFPLQVDLLYAYEQHKHGVVEFDPVDIQFLISKIQVPTEKDPSTLAKFSQLRFGCGHQDAPPTFKFPTLQAQPSLQEISFDQPTRIWAACKYLRARLAHSVPFDVETVSFDTLCKYYRLLKKDFLHEPVDKLIRTGLLPAVEYLYFCRKDSPGVHNLAADLLNSTSLVSLEGQATCVVQGQAKPTIPTTGRVLRDISAEPKELLALRCLTPSPELLTRDNECLRRADDYLVVQEVDQAVVPEFLSADSVEIAGDKAVRRKFAEASEDVAFASALKAKTCQKAQGKELVGAVSLETELEQSLTSAQKELQQMEIAIVQSVAAACTSDPEFYATFAAKRRFFPGINELCLLCGKPDAKKYITARFPLSDEAVATLQASTRAYLLQKQYAQQLDRGFKLCRTVANMKKDSPELSVGLAQLHGTLAAKREYADNDIDAPILLMIETTLNIKLRRDQVDNIRKLISGFTSDPPRSEVLQMIMGAGKTSVIQPILGFLLARPEYLSVVDVPEALLEAVKQQLSAVIGDAFDQYVYTIDYQRKLVRGTQGLEYLKMFRDKLREIKQSQGCWLRTSRVKHSMITSLYEVVYELKEAKTRGDEGALAALRERYALISEICALAEANERVQIDEIDSTMNSQVIFKYPLGRPKLINKDRGLFLADRLIDLAENAGTISLDFADMYRRRLGQQVEGGRAFSEEDYEAMSVDMAHRAMASLKGKVLPRQGESPERFDAEFALYVEGFLRQTLMPEREKEVREKIPPKASSENIQELLEKSKRDFIVEAGGWIREHTSPEDRQIFGVTADAITNIFKTSLTRKCGIHYGIDPNPDRYAARPYSAAHAPKVTMYADPYELAVYSIQKTLYEGIPDGPAKAMLFRLQEKAKKEAKGGVPIADTEGYREFLSIMGKTEGEKYRFLEQPPAAACLETFRNLASCNRDALHTYFSDYLFPQINLYDRNVASTPQTLAGSSAQVCGYTGTLQTGVLHRDMKASPEKGTDGQTMLAIERKMASGQSETICPDGSPLDYVVSTFAGPEVDVLIDSGGLLKDVNIQDFADQLIAAKKQSDPDIRGVIYHNSEGEIIIRREVPGGGFENLPYDSSTYTPDPNNRYLTIIAQKYERGANIPQRPTAKAVMTLRKGMTKVDALQAAFRMRQILKGQSVSFVVPAEVRDHMASKLWKGAEAAWRQGTLTEDQIRRLPCGQEAKDSLCALLKKSPSTESFPESVKGRFIETLEVTSQALWRYMTANEALAQKDKNWMAAKQRLREAIEKPCRLAWENPHLSEQGRMTLFENVRGLLFQASEDAPFEKMTVGFHNVRAEAALETEIDKHILMVRNIWRTCFGSGDFSAAIFVIHSIMEKIGFSGEKGTIFARNEEAFFESLRTFLRSGVTIDEIAETINIAESPKEQEIELQTEVQVEQQAEQQAEIQQEIQVERPPADLVARPYVQLIPNDRDEFPNLPCLFDATVRITPIQSLISRFMVDVFPLRESFLLDFSPNAFPDGKLSSFLNPTARYMLLINDHGTHRYALISHDDEARLKRGLARYQQQLGKERSVTLMSLSGATIASSLPPEEAEKITASEEARRVSLLARLYTGDPVFSSRDIKLLETMVHEGQKRLEEVVNERKKLLGNGVNERGKGAAEIVSILKSIYETALRTKPGAAAAYRDGELRKFFYRKRPS